MPSRFNGVIVGHLGGAPETRQIASGVTVCDFSVAVNNGHFDKDKQEWVEEDPTWFRVTLWRDAAVKLAEKNLQAGDVVYIEAHKVNASAYIDSQGEARATIEVQSPKIVLAMRQSSSSSSASSGVGGSASGWNDEPF